MTSNGDNWRCRRYLRPQEVSALRNVPWLDLSQCNGVTDVSLLGGHNTLSLRSCQKISDVSSLGSVERLDLAGCSRVVDVSALGGAWQCYIGDRLFKTYRLDSDPSKFSHWKHRRNNDCWQFNGRSWKAGPPHNNGESLLSLFGEKCLLWCVKNVKCVCFYSQRALIPMQSTQSSVCNNECADWLLISSHSFVLLPT